MNLFESTDYKVFLIDLIKSKPRGFQSALAKAMDCQASYLITVLNRKGDLTEEQCLKATDFLNFSYQDKEYFLLLLSLSRAATPQLRTFYMDKISKFQKSQEEIKNKVPTAKELDIKFSTEYFSNWDVSTVHLATSIPEYQDPAKIADRFRLSRTRVNAILEFLEKNNLVLRQKSHWVFNGSPVFLNKNSALHVIHQINSRDQTLRSIREQDPSDIHFSSVFAINSTQFQQLKKEIKILIENAHKKIESSPSEEIYSLVIDLFKVI